MGKASRRVEGKPEEGKGKSPTLAKEKLGWGDWAKTAGVLPVVSGNLCLVTQSCLTSCNIP